MDTVGFLKQSLQPDTPEFVSGFHPQSLVWLWLDRTLNFFWATVCLSEKREYHFYKPKGNQSWIFTGRTDAEAEVPILRPPDVKN